MTTTWRWFGLDEEEDGPCVFNLWDVVHFFSGVTAYAYLYIVGYRIFGLSFWPRFWIWFFIHVLYEVKDQVLEISSLPDSLGDQFSTMVGFTVTHLLTRLLEGKEKPRKSKINLFSESSSSQ